ncbi:RDD family protein [uncultured Planktosalinus sp.]|uniref:RDD family protein n=1 Tax=uncultured Planktosalinus sp. TaxID=1810935 RepID=UPI0030D97C05
MEKVNKYGSWLNRLLAYVIDIIIITIVVMPLNYLNITGKKSFILYLLITLISISYKPLLEFYYKKTIGKHFLKLTVVSINFNSIGIGQSYLRNVFFILPSLLSIPFYYLAFNDPILLDVNDFKYFASLMSSKYPLQGIISSLTFLFIVVDFLFLLFDGKKKNRTLHDIFAKTVVLQS